MKLNRTTRTILSVTALAWSIPLAQAGASPLARTGGVVQPQTQTAERLASTGSTSVRARRNTPRTGGST
jgi:hypothetical protein